MCGIVGIINKNEQVNQELLQKMLTRIAHRGPDENGTYIENNIGLGSVRLSIIDIFGGQQPMANEDFTLWIVFNGEIFNYIELKKDLEKKGHHFRTSSDTEVVVHLYEEYGEGFLTKLNGQFAFAIWDKKGKELFLARDRVGIRPLFYFHNKDMFIYGSEIKAIFEHPEVNRKISVTGIAETFTFWSTVSPNTIFEGINECPPGHFIKYKDGKISINKYWQLKFTDKENYFPGTMEDAINEFDTLFEDAVRIRLRADVPVAAYLSGGLDSCVTTSYIKRIAPEALQTFSIGFAEKEFDESYYQNIASNYFGTSHLSFQCSSKEVADNFPKVIWHSETPMLRTSPSPMYSLSKKVRENNIKVVITGEGADEILAGYNIFKENKIRNFWAKMPESKLRPLLLKRLYPYISSLQNANPNALKMFFGYKLNETNSPIYSHLLRWNNSSKTMRHLNQDIMDEIKDFNPYEKLLKSVDKRFNNLEPLAKAQYWEMTTFLSGYLLSSQGDRMAMGNSVEGRYPFLDHRVIEFCASLPPDFKLKGLTEKILLKRMMKDRIPKEILNRQKQAYRAPITSSFLGKDAPDYINELLSTKAIKESNIFNPVSVSRLKEKINSGKAYSETDSMALTAIISTQLLFKQFIKEFKYLKKEQVIHSANKVETI